MSMPYLIYPDKNNQPQTRTLNYGANRIGLAPDNDIVVNNQTVYRIGRAPDNDIVVDNQTVSRLHAEIIVTPQYTKIIDCKSRNKTKVNGVEVKPNEERYLQDGDVITCGEGVEFQYCHPSLAKNVSIIKQIPLKVNQSIIAELPAKKNPADSILRLEPENKESLALNKLKILLEFSQQLYSPAEPEELLKTILDLVFQILAIDRAVILWFNEETQELEEKASKVLDGVPNSRLYSKKITDKVFQKGEAMLIQDAPKDIASLSVMKESIQSAICVPLRTNKGISGVLYLDNVSTKPIYSDEDLEFIIGLANQAAVAIHTAYEIHQREQKIQRKLNDFAIQIDKAKLDLEVAQIVDLDWYQELIRLVNEEEK